MPMRIFQEPEPDMVAHTKISKFLRIPYINAWVSVGAREGWPACTKVGIQASLQEGIAQL